MMADIYLDFVFYATLLIAIKPTGFFTCHTIFIILSHNLNYVLFEELLFIFAAIG